MKLHDLLIECAQNVGFPLAGTVDLDLAEQDSQNSIRKHISVYDEWIQSGFSGEMGYLVRGKDRRANPRLVFPEVQSIFCVALPYPRKLAGANNPNEGPRYARYLQGPDYHHTIIEKLERVMEQVNLRWSASTRSSLVKTDPLKWKICVDTSAVLERSWAALAGLGWIGKNTLLIHPKLGSYLFLGEVLINQKTNQAPSPLPNYCGHCTRCLDACPTQALQINKGLNSNRCISYWTLEKRGEITVKPSEKDKMGLWIAGCDICQEVCPFNNKPSKLEEQEALGSTVSPLSNSTDLNTWIELLKEDFHEYRSRVKNSALSRVKPAQFSRNLAISLTNALKTAQNQEAFSLRENLAPYIYRRFETETDEVAKAEWKECVSQLIPASNLPELEFDSSYSKKPR